jgi:regulator of chromosome condensation
MSSARASKKRAASPVADSAAAAAAPPSKRGRKAKSATAAVDVEQTILANSGLNRVPNGSQGVILAFGSGDCAQLGCGADEKMRERKKPTLIKSTEKQNVISIAVGSLHNLVLVSPSRAVWSWGCNDDQALGRSDDEWYPAPLSGPLGKGNSDNLPGGVVQIGAGASHSIALTATGDVYSWGTYRDANGVIGFSDTVEAATEPILLTALPKNTKVIHIAAGEAHDVLLTEHGEGQLDIFMHAFSYFFIC